MEQGSLGELYLTRSVIKHIRKKNTNVITGAAVGNDFARLRLEGDFVCTEAVAAEPYIAWVKAFNNLAVSGAEKTGARIVLLLPADAEEKDIKEYMHCFNSMADEENVQIIGGHSQVSSAYARASFCVEAYGQSGINIEKAEDNFQIIMAGYTGVLGARLIAENKYNELVKHFSTSYIDGFLAYNDDMSIEKVAKIMAANNVCYMHDVSFGGVYGALWQLGAGIKKGMEINHFKLPIRQETIEICEYFNINPYLLDGTGGLLGVFRDGKNAVNSLRKSGITAEIIGSVSAGRDRTVFTDTDKRFLQPPGFDEIYKIINI